MAIHAKRSPIVDRLAPSSEVPAASAPIYLDNAATTRVAPEVFAAMRPFFCDEFANAATLYKVGARAAEAVERAREKVARLLGAPDAGDIVFTSGGTESNNWVITSSVFTSGKRHIVTSAIEHHSVLETVRFLERSGICEATILPVDNDGLVNPDELRRAIRTDTALVTVMHANNEVGTLQPISEFAEIAHERGVLFHTDAVQTVGKIPVDVHELGVDFLSASAHKFEGPKGTGVLYIREGIRVTSLHHGGGQERNRRAGTTNVPGAVGMGAAAMLAERDLEASMARETELVERLWDGLSACLPEIRRSGHRTQRIPNLLNICVPGVEGDALLLGLDRYGVQVSVGSACTAASPEPSHVLIALGIPAEVSRGAVRFSLGRNTTSEDINYVIDVLPRVAARLRPVNPTSHTSDTLR